MLHQQLIGLLCLDVVYDKTNLTLLLRESCIPGKLIAGTLREDGYKGYFNRDIPLGESCGKRYFLPKNKAA